MKLLNIAKNNLKSIFDNTKKQLVIKYIKMQIRQQYNLLKLIEKQLENY